MTSDHDGVVCRDVHRSFGPVHAVRGVDLDAPPGEVTALVGPNGSGKTTLLLVLATLLVPDGGTVRVAGFDPVTRPREVRARTGWAPDAFGLYDDLTVREYVAFHAAAHRVGRVPDRVAELLELVHLDGHAEDLVSVLSRGQKQRLGLTRALVHDPSVLLLDEPAAGLDPRSRVELRELLRRLAADGAAVLVSSHVLGDLEEVADRVVFVDGGRTVASERLDALAASAAGRTWRLRSLDEALLAAALTDAGVAWTRTPAGDADVTVTGEAAAAGLLARLVRAGVPVSGFGPVGSALEAAYLELTAGDRR